MARTNLRENVVADPQCLCLKFVKFDDNQGSCHLVEGSDRLNFLALRDVLLQEVIPRYQL